MPESVRLRDEALERVKRAEDLFASRSEGCRHDPCVEDHSKVLRAILDRLHLIEAVEVSIDEFLDEVYASLLVNLEIKLDVFGIATLVTNLEHIDPLLDY